jgi:acyl-coenzyme A thioesterase PaaI-like protein
VEELIEKDRGPEGVFAEFGLVITPESDELAGRAAVVPGMNLPGTDTLRMSVLATWADTIFGLIAMRTIAPRIPVTLEMDLHLFAPIQGASELHMRGRLVKAGKSVMIFSLDFHDADSKHVGFGHSMFMAAPDPELKVPPGDWAIKRFDRQRGPLLQRPLAQRVGCEVREPGLAVFCPGPATSATRPGRSTAAFSRCRSRTRCCRGLAPASPSPRS